MWAPLRESMETTLHRLINGDARELSYLPDASVMVAALRSGRNSIGIEIDPDYCRMAARYLKAETGDFFSAAELRFERAPTETAAMVREDNALYEVRPAKKRLE